MYITCSLDGRLRNYFFIVISTWAYAKTHNLEFVMDKSFENDKYYKIFFSSIKTQYLSTTIFINPKLFANKICSKCKCVLNNNLMF